MKTTARARVLRSSSPSTRPRSPGLARFRRRIDDVDTALVALLSERTTLSVAVARLKRRAGLPLRTPAREAEVIRQAGRAVRGPLTPQAAARIFRAILIEMRALQRLAPARR
jgi:chorismate mutase